ncbi:MazG-like family protein [Selenomonadales bacterium OttesenSCG-928-I06]|nr:MazG-like family protein [Selenomonadales bacterium OttesenSCG-928-I06]
MLSQESDILKKLRIVESLKADLASSLAEFYQDVAKGKDKQEINESLAEIIISTYILARRLGTSYPELDEATSKILSEKINREPEIERLFGDFTKLKDHIKR